MSETTEFDSFYGDARRTALLQALVLTRNPSTAADVTVAAFAAAWGRWRRIRRIDDPAAWVRERILEFSSTPRQPSSTASASASASTSTSAPVAASSTAPVPTPDEEQRALLATFDAMTGTQRAAWVLVEGVGVSVATAAAELASTPTELRTDLSRAREMLQHPIGAPLGPPAVDRESHDGTGPSHARSQSDDAWTTPDVLVVLDDLVRQIDLPTPPRLRAQHTRQLPGTTKITAAGKPLWRVVGAAVAIAIVATAVWIVLSDGPTEDRAGEEPRSGASGTAGRGEEVPPTALLTAQALTGLGRGSWAESATTSQPPNTGPASICQLAGSPDPAALGVQERRFESASAEAQQTLVVSRSGALAQTAYERSVGWWGSCPGRTVLLQSVYEISGVGDASLVLTLRDWSRPTASYVVALGRAGSAIVSLVSVDPVAAAQAPPEQLPGTPQEAAAALARALESACELESAECTDADPLVGASGTSGEPGELVRVAPPSPPGGRGLLGTIDLPPPGDLSQAWSASPPISPEGELRPADDRSASTRCDDLAFGEQGAENVYTRVFEVPGDPDLPSYFGLAQTVGTFASERRAAEVLDAVVDRFDSCTRRVESAQVAQLSRDLSRRPGTPGRPIAESASWGLAYEDEDQGRVFVRTAVVRNGRTLARLTFTPGPSNDLTLEQFAAVVVRARTRLAATAQTRLPS